nr:retrotransposon Orf1 [Tanacetum cinerariifolium]
MRVQHHEKQVESVLRYIEELYFHYIEKMEEKLVKGWMIILRDFNEVKSKLKEARTLIRELQKKGRSKGMHVFVGNFTYVIDFIIVEDISSIIDPRLSQVVLGKPFVKISNMTHDPPEGVVRFTNKTDEIAYKMPHKIKQYNSLLDLEREHINSVYLRNEEDKRRGVEYVMSKILRKFFKKNKEKIFTVAGDDVRIHPDNVTPLAM